MEAFRHSYIIKNNKLTITLPKNFKATEVDVIILPVEENDWYNDLTGQQKDAIERGRTQLKAGVGILHKEVQQRIRKLIERKKSA